METERTDNILNELNSTACISDLKSDIIKYIPTKSTNNLQVICCCVQLPVWNKI